MMIFQRIRYSSEGGCLHSSKAQSGARQFVWVNLLRIQVMLILPLIIWVSVVAFLNSVVAQTISEADIEGRLSDIASRYGEEDPLSERLQCIYTTARDLLYTFAKSV